MAKIEYSEGCCCLCGKKLKDHEYQICDDCDFQTG